MLEAVTRPLCEAAQMVYTYTLSSGRKQVYYLRNKISLIVFLLVDMIFLLNQNIHFEIHLLTSSNIYAMYFEGISTMHERVKNQWRYYFMALKSGF